MLEPSLAFAGAHFEDFVEDLKALVRIPSVSFPGFEHSHLEASAQAIARLLEGAGLEHVEVLRLPGAHPYVYADWLHAPGKPTVILYAHHDVQPPGRDEKWRSPAFEPTARGGRLFGRGTADDKAGVVIHSGAIASYMKTAGALPLNVKVLFEGEEETGSEHLPELLARHGAKLQADVVILTDTGNFKVGVPTVTTALRGLVAVDVEVRTADHPLHSGMWGGPLADPVQALAKMLAALTDGRGRIAIPGIYKDVQPMTKTERDSLRRLKYTDRDFRKEAQVLPGVKLLGGPAAPLEKLWRLPAVSVNAIQASSRKDVANIVNDSAWCRVGLRLAPAMSPARTLAQLKRFLRRSAPWGAKVAFSNESVGPWWSTNPDGPVFRAASRALAAGYGRETVFVGCGGSIPFVGPFAKALGGAPAILVGVEDPASNPHSENESLHLDDFRKSILSMVRLYRELGGLSAAEIAASKR